MRNILIVILTLVSIGYVEAREVTEYDAVNNDVGISVIPETKYNKDMTITTVYCGYSVSRAQEVTHGINIGFASSICQVMLGADFKITCSSPSINTHSWGGYGIVGWQGDIIGIGMMVGGISQYVSCEEVRYLGYDFDGRENNEDYCRVEYKTAPMFDGGIMMSFVVPTDYNLGLSIMLSSTYYSPFSISIGMYFPNCY